MIIPRNLAILAAITIMVLLPLGSAKAIQITYDAADLPDSGPGDLWQYTYVVSDHTFLAGTGFSIYFDAALYAQVEDFALVDTADGLWNLLSWDPDPMFPGDGIFDAYANVDNPALPYAFVVDFIWTGSGAPGAQAFDVYNAMPFAIVTSGDTIPASSTGPIPEPATMFLLGTGLIGLAGCGKKMRK